MASLAPPSSSAPSNAHRNLETPRPQPASARPRKLPHQLPVWNLAKVPFRLFSPPRATGMVGSVRSLKATHMSDVRLADVIANKHLSPLSLKDFEGYLVFKEYSAENLYFILWLNEYEKEYAAYMKDSSIPKKEAQPTLNTDPSAPRTAAHLPQYLAESLRRGLAVFFAPDGPLELNLPRATRDRSLVDAGNSGDPKDFIEARDIVEHSLNRSLAAYTKTCVANAGPRRLVFCWSLGFFVFLLGLIPPFVGIFGHHARGYRAIGLPFLGLGMAIMVMAVNRICAVIWLLGEDRQLLPWELASPTVTSGSIVPINCPTTPSSAASSWEDESSYGGYNDDTKSPDTSFRTQTSANPYPWEKQDAELSSTPAVAQVDFTPSSPTASSRPPSYRSGGTTSRGVVPGSAPVFGPVTSVFSPDVARAQWRLAVYALGIGLLTVCTIGVLLMAVPNQ